MGDFSVGLNGGVGIGGQLLGWVAEPSRYILMSEPPARRDGDYFYHWHYRRGASDIGWCQFTNDTQRFISPVLFVDGHVAKHDFTKTILANPLASCEPTKDWMWYQSTGPQGPALASFTLTNGTIIGFAEFLFGVTVSPPVNQYPPVQISFQTNIFILTPPGHP
jgi:prepilin-type processing-associated H-X9-DG protein